MERHLISPPPPTPHSLTSRSRDHILPGLLRLMCYSPVTTDMYNEPSFLRTPAHMTYLAKLMYSLSEFNITIDPSLTYGIS